MNANFVQRMSFAIKQKQQNMLIAEPVRIQLQWMTAHGDVNAMMRMLFQ